MSDPANEGAGFFKNRLEHSAGGCLLSRRPHRKNPLYGGFAMHRILIALTCATLIVCAFFHKGTSTEVLLQTGTTNGGSAMPAETAKFLTGDLARPPGDCVAGCSIANHPIESLTETDFLNLVDDFGSGTTTLSTEALETLLFHGSDTRAFLTQAGTVDLTADQRTFLESELAKTHVRLWFRVVDDSDVVRARLDGALFAIGAKTHVHLEQNRNLPVPEISGTVHRTGVNHLWVRV
jgi:hypothetical protein